MRGMEWSLGKLRSLLDRDGMHVDKELDWVARDIAVKASRYRCRLGCDIKELECLHKAADEWGRRCERINTVIKAIQAIPSISVEQALEEQALKNREQQNASRRRRRDRLRAAKIAL